MIDINRISLSPPWATFYREIKALFKDDPEIKIEYDEQKIVLKLFVENEEKASALACLLPSEKKFGNVTMKIMVVPANSVGVSNKSLFEKAFKGNPALAYLVDAKKSATVPFADFAVYVVFKKKVVQFFNDDLSDAHGVKSTLYQDIAADVFGTVEGIAFCTDTDKQRREAPLGSGLD